MTIEEAVARYTQAPSDTVLVAKAPLTWGAEAMFIKLTNECAVPQPATDAGYEYLLERDEIAGLMKILECKQVSSRTAAEFIIHYAIYDSTPAWIDDIPTRAMDDEREVTAG